MITESSSLSVPVTLASACVNFNIAYILFLYTISSTLHISFLAVKRVYVYLFTLLACS